MLSYRHHITQTQLQDEPAHPTRCVARVAAASWHLYALSKNRVTKSSPDSFMYGGSMPSSMS